MRLRLAAPAALAAALVLAFSVTTPAFADTPRETAVDIDVPAAPLGQALNTLASQLHVQLAVDPALVRNLQAPAISGHYTLRQALTRILAGTHLVATEKDGVLLIQVSSDARTSTTSLDAITVTGLTSGYVAHETMAATKTSTPLLETPQSITVITRDQLDARAVESVSQALRYTPGVLAEEFGGVETKADYFSLRGFPDANPYLDGLSTLTYFTVLAPVIETEGLDRVEVLRGPSSVLYGQATSPGGMVSVVSKHPLDTPLHELSAATGAYGRAQGSFDLSGPLDKDRHWLYRVTGLGLDTGTQTDHVRDKRVFIAPAVTWAPSDDTHLTLLTHYSYRDANSPPNDLPIQGTLWGNPNGKIPSDFYDGDPDFDRFARREYALGYEFEHRFNDVVTFRQNARYAHANLDYSIIGSAGLEDDLRTLDRYGFRTQASSDVAGGGNQAEVRFDTGQFPHPLLAGVDYLHAEDRWAEQDPEIPSLDIYAPVYGITVDLPPVDYSVTHTIRQLGTYAQDQMRIEHWAATVSVRQDWASTQTIDRLEGTSDTQKSNRLTWRAGLVYLLDNGIAPYINASTAFTPSTGTSFEGSPFKPNLGKSYEAGVKFQPRGQNSYVMASVYQLTQSNVLTTDLDHPEFQVQSGEVRVRGAEVSAVADLGNGLSLITGYTWMNGVQLRNNDGTQGKRPRDVPRNMANLWLDKTFLSGALRGFGVAGGLRYVGSTYGDLANTIRLPSTTLVDAAIRYEIPQWRFSLNAQNLFDKEYIGSCQGELGCQYGLRRAWMAKATFSW